MAEPSVPTPEPPDVDRLWTPADLARYLGLAETTVSRMANAEPHKLPPRVATLFKPRWDPGVCRRWVVENSVVVGVKRKRGRPRKRWDVADGEVAPS